MTVVENTFSAQYGHTISGFITYTTKSGTSKLHGNVYDFYTDQRFDASNWFVGPQLIQNKLPNKLALGQNNWGFALGGPIPKLKKTFWFFNLDGLDYHSTVNTGFVNIIPTAKQAAGDFSELLDKSAPIGTDALGRKIWSGEIFDPSTTTTVGGKLVRDGFGFDSAGNPTAQANIIPTGYALLSPMALTVAGKIPAPDTNTTFTPPTANAGILMNPNGFGGSSDDNNKINVRTWLFRFDHQFNDKFTINNTYYENVRPRIAHCGGPQGCNTVNNGETASAKNDTYIGQGFYQRITNHFEHLQMNWIIKPNVFNHTTLAYDRWQMLGHQLSGGAGWNQSLGLGLPNQPIFDNAGFPQLNFSGTYGYTHYGTPWASQGADINNRYQFLDDVTWVTGKHTLKAGVEYRYMTFPQTGWAVNTGGNFTYNAKSTAGFDNSGNLVSGSKGTGNELASFLLGQVDGANFSIPFKYMPKMKYGSFWGNDDIKVKSNLTVTLGLRLDWQGGLSEEFNRFSTFEPGAPNPVDPLNPSATVPGATVFNANKAYGKSSWNVGPRVGFAYSINPKTVIRGGYGMYYAGVQADSWDPYPVDGYQTNPSVSNLLNDVLPTFYMGGPSSATSSGCAMMGTAVAAYNVAHPSPTPVINNCDWPTGSIVQPSSQTLVPNVANGGSPVGVDPKTYTMPRYQNWSVSFQRQLARNMGIDIAYVGNHGTRLIDGRSSAGVYDNMNPGSVLTTYTTAQLLDQFQGGACQDLVNNCGGVAAPYPTFTGTVAQALRTWPQYQQINWRFFPFGNSHYNALQVAFNAQMTAGLMLKVAYTHSKLMNNGSETGLGAGGPPVQDPGNVKSLVSVSSDDVPNIFSLGWVYHLPFGKGRTYMKQGFADKVLGGWQISGIQSYSSGRPLSIIMNNDKLSSVLFNYNHFPNKAGSGKSGHFSNPRTDTYLSLAGWSDPGAYAFGNAPRNDASVRGFPYYNEDLSIQKDTYFGEEKYVRFEADAGNLLNRQFFCPVDQNWSDGGGFGQTHSQCNIPRRIQFGLQVFF